MNCTSVSASSNDRRLLWQLPLLLPSMLLMQDAVARLTWECAVCYPPCLAYKLKLSDVAASRGQAARMHWE